MFKKEVLGAVRPYLDKSNFQTTNPDVDDVDLDELDKTLPWMSFEPSLTEIVGSLKTSKNHDTKGMLSILYSLLLY